MNNNNTFKGTGTSAFYLNKHLINNAKVVTVPCVGDIGYLNAQFEELFQQDNECNQQNVDSKKSYREILVLDTCQQTTSKKFNLWKTIH